MRRTRWLVAAGALAGGLWWAPWAASQPKRVTVRPDPKPEPVAETRLLMQGLNESNFKALDRFLRGKPPAEAEPWLFARGQALLIAETGNLLLLRPPQKGGQEVWKEASVELRERAALLARQIAARDRDKARAALADLSATCNRCHQTFRVAVRVTPSDQAE
jgi:cytochrome c556